MSDMYAYKIRNKSTGLFAKKGRYVKWGKVGNRWHRRSDVEAHLRQSVRDLSRYDDAEIITYRLVECERTDMNGLLESEAKLRKDRDDERTGVVPDFVKKFVEDNT